MTAFLQTLAIKPEDALRAIARYRARLAVDVGPQVVIVEGGNEPHYVDLNAAAWDWCDCAHATFNDALCVHVVAALILTDDERAIATLGAAMRTAWLDQAPRPPARPTMRNGMVVR